MEPLHPIDPPPPSPPSILAKQEKEEGEEVGITNDEEDKDDNAVTDENNDTVPPPPEPPQPKPKSSMMTMMQQRIIAFYFEYQFLLHILAAIGVARLYPRLGTEYLAPQITATWIAVVIIFFVSGIGLRTDEFSQAFQQVYFNIYVQVVNFGVVSATVFLVTRFLVHVVPLLNETLADGMVVCSCLPMAINIVIVLTGAANGDEASAVFHTTFSNIVGIFLSPALILAYLGSKSDVALADVFFKLTLKVVVPLAVGQILQKSSPAILLFAKRYKSSLKKVQESCLVFIIYIVFCQTFAARNEGGDERSVGFGQVFFMILCQFLFMVSFLTLGWYSLGFLFPNQPKRRVMGVYGCPAKTIALGIPLINSMYEGNPDLALYALPLLVWHPTQLVVGTLVAPRLAAYVQAELKRLDEEEETKEEEDDDEEIKDKDTVVPTGTDLEAAASDDHPPPPPQ